MTEAGISSDALLGGRLRLLQPRRGHRAGTDAVLLAACATAQDGETIVDLGAATGAVGMMVALRVPGVRVVLVERDPALVGLARENLILNGLDARGEVVEADVLAPRTQIERAGLRPGMADLVVTNPPFAEAGDMPRSPDVGRAQAHELPTGGLRVWLQTSAHLLRHKGRLILIQRADKLGACLEAIGRQFGGVCIRPVRPKAGADAIRIIVSAVKGGRGPLRIGSEIVLHERSGGFTPDVARAQEGESL
jgi:tRNA1(Val) A37 N6-methylase TrmN6